MIKVDGVIVVEGKSDVAFLSNFIDAQFVTTNGSEISKETIEYLKTLSKNKDIYVLTDPDFPGERIRKVLDENIPNLKHCFVSKDKSIKHGKVGVAESTVEEVENALKNAITSKTTNLGSITTSDLVSLGLSGAPNSEENRKKVSEHFHLGYSNSKTFLKRLNYCNITIEEIKKVLWTLILILKTSKHISF